MSPLHRAGAWPLAALWIACLGGGRPWPTGRVPAGPRLLILDHVGTYREAYKHDLKVRAKRSSGGAKPLES